MRIRAFLAIILATLALPGVTAAQGEVVIDRPLSQTPINLSRIAPDATFSQATAQPKSDSLANGMLIGAGIGVVVGMLVVPRAMCGPNDSECSTIVRVAIGLPVIAGGLGIGALVDSRHKQDARAAGVNRDASLGIDERDLSHVALAVGREELRLSLLRDDPPPQ